MKNTVKEHPFNQWLADLKFDKVDEEDQVVRVGCRDPFRAAYMVGRYGDNLDKVRITSFDAEDKVRVMLVVNHDMGNEKFVRLEFGTFAEVSPFLYLQHSTKFDKIYVGLDI